MRRASVVVTVVAVIGAVVWIVASRGQPVSSPTNPTVSATAAAPPPRLAARPSSAWTPSSPRPSSSTRTPTSTPPTRGAAPADEHAWEQTVRQFGTRYADGANRDVRTWSAALKPYVSKAIYDELRASAVIPRGHYDSAELLQATSTRISAEVTYTEGWSLVVYLSPGEKAGRWLVTAYDALDEGDAD